MQFSGATEGHVAYFPINNYYPCFRGGEIIFKGEEWIPAYGTRQEGVEKLAADHLTRTF